MSSNALVKREGGGIKIETFDDLQRFARAAAASGYFQDAKDVAQALVKVQYGLELGISPIAAMTGIHVIEGKPALGAGLIASRIRASGRYDYRVLHLDETRCEIAFFDGGREVGRSAFTIEDAKRAEAKFTTRSGAPGQWQKFPRNMLFARALSNGARWYCPDVFQGSVYTPEELGSGVGDVEDLSGVVDAEVMSAARVADDPGKLPEGVAPSPATGMDDAPEQRRRKLGVALCAMPSGNNDTGIRDRDRFLSKRRQQGYFTADEMVVLDVLRRSYDNTSVAGGRDTDGMNAEERQILEGAYTLIEEIEAEQRAAREESEQ